MIDKPPDKPTPPVPPRKHHGGYQSAATSAHLHQPSFHELIKLEADRRDEEGGEDEETDVCGNALQTRDRDLVMMKNNNVINHQHHQRQHLVLKHNNHNQNQPPIPTPRYKKEVVISLDPLFYLTIFIVFFILNIY